MRFSNKIPKYSRFSVPPLTGQKSPAEQRFVGGVFALSACYIGKVAGLLHCLRASALFALRFFRLVFDNWFGGSIGVRRFLRLQIRYPASSPTCPCAWSPTSASARYRLVRLVRIFRCEPLWLHARALPAYTSGARLSPSAIHTATLGRYVSVLEASATSTLPALAESIRASVLPALAEFTRTSALPTLVETTGTSALPTLDVLIRTLANWTIWSSWSLEALVKSPSASALPSPNVLVRPLAVRAIWARYPGIVRLCRIEVCVHSRSAAHSASPSLSAAATASTRTGKRLTGQNRHCQHNNDRCFDSCLFHFRFLSLMFHFAAYLSPILGSFYGDSGADRKKVTHGINFSGKISVPPDVSVEIPARKEYNIEVLVVG